LLPEFNITNSLPWWQPVRPLFVGLAFALVLPNYWLEARKWQLLFPKADRPSNAMAFRAVLIGQAFGILTPNRIGDYLGRTIATEKLPATKVLATTLVARVLQVLPTLTGGLLALLLLMGIRLSSPAEQPPISWLVWAILFGLLALGLALVLPEGYRLLLRKLKLRWKHWILPIQSALVQTNRRVLVLTYVRYLVFLAQYFSLLWAFDAPLSEPIVWLLPPLVFGIKSFVPSLALAELGIREGIAVGVGLWLGISSAIVLQATAALFVVNLLLPACTGGLLLLLYRSTRKPAEQLN
jgi:hypothetical protein